MITRIRIKCPCGASWKTGKNTPKCPNCGRTPPPRKGQYGWLLVIIGILLVLWGTYDDSWFFAIVGVGVLSLGYMTAFIKSKRPEQEEAGRKGNHPPGVY